MTLENFNTRLLSITDHRRICGPASDKHISLIEQYLENEGGFVLPKGYYQMLQNINGFVFSDFNFYSCLPSPPELVLNVIDENEQWRNEIDEANGYFFIGDDSSYFYCIRLENTSYCRLGKEDFELESDFESLEDMLDEISIVFRYN